MYWQTVSPTLSHSLHKLMEAPELNAFRLVGGTALSLHFGHRLSVDIDLFTDHEYGSINFDSIVHSLKNEFEYVDQPVQFSGLGSSFFIGESADESIKLDIFYTDTFIDPVHLEDNVRMATPAEIAAMKLEVVSNGGRKKDFWDIHELLDYFSIDEMLELHERRYPHGHDRAHILHQFTDFSKADHEFTPVCLRGKHWEVIRFDIAEAIEVVK